MRSAVPFLLTVLLAPMAASAARGQDRVDLRVGAPLAGQVLSEDYKKVKIKVRGGAEKDVPAAAVVDVVRDDAPDSYREGRMLGWDAAKERVVKAEVRRPGYEGDGKNHEEPPRRPNSA